MIKKGTAKEKSTQLQMVSIDQLVPEEHILRKIDKYVDFDFIYDLVEDKYSPDFGRPSIDPVTLIKIPIIQYMFGIKSMRQTMKEIEVNVAYRWFLGLDFYDEVPHFSTFGKNYKRRFEGTDLFEQIFTRILYQCMEHKLVDTNTMFVDSTHVKARANRKKSKKILVAKKTAKYYDEKLKEEINTNREAHGKKPLKDKDDHNNPSGGCNTEELEGKELQNGEEVPEGMKTQKISTVDSESGWFHKGEHKEVFAYSVEAACDKNGWMLGYSVHPGNEHDSITFTSIYEKLQKFNPKTIVMDAGYKVPAIAKLLIDNKQTPVFPYKRPMTKKGFFKKYEYVYDEYYDCYICPNNQVLKYSTTNRKGYREYKSNGNICANCPYLSKCTESKEHVKVITQHVWEPYMEICEEIRHTNGMKALYDMRKETIEKQFGTAKECHGFRYTQEIGNEKMRMKAGLTFACLNMKKLVRILENSSKPKKKTSKQSVLQYFFAVVLPHMDFRSPCGLKATASV